MCWAEAFWSVYHQRFRSLVVWSVGQTSCTEVLEEKRGKMGLLSRSPILHEEVVVTKKGVSGKFLNRSGCSLQVGFFQRPGAKRPRKAELRETEEEIHALRVDLERRRRWSGQKQGLEKRNPVKASPGFSNDLKYFRTFWPWMPRFFSVFLLLKAFWASGLFLGSPPGLWRIIWDWMQDFRADIDWNSSMWQGRHSPGCLVLLKCFFSFSMFQPYHKAFWSENYVDFFLIFPGVIKQIQGCIWRLFCVSSQF